MPTRTSWKIVADGLQELIHSKKIISYSWKNLNSNPEVMENSENGDSSEDEDKLPLINLLNQLPVAETITKKDVSDCLNGYEQCKLLNKAITIFYVTEV